MSVVAVAFAHAGPGALPDQAPTGLLSGGLPSGGARAACVVPTFAYLGTHNVLLGFWCMQGGAAAAHVGAGVASSGTYSALLGLRPSNRGSAGAQVRLSSACLGSGVFCGVRCLVGELRMRESGPGIACTGNSIS